MHEEVVDIGNYKTKVLENFKLKKPTIVAVDLDNMLIPFNYSNFWSKLCTCKDISSKAT